MLIGNAPASRSRNCCLLAHPSVRCWTPAESHLGLSGGLRELLCKAARVTSREPQVAVQLHGSTTVVAIVAIVTASSPLRACALETFLSRPQDKIRLFDAQNARLRC
jgi:hypothetical protein